MKRSYSRSHDTSSPPRKKSKINYLNNSSSSSFVKDKNRSKISLNLVHDFDNEEYSSSNSSEEDENSVYLVDRASLVHSNQKHTFQNTIPLDTLSHVFTFLSTHDICRASQVCYNWAQAARRPTFWNYVNKISHGSVKNFAQCKRFTTIPSLTIDTRCTPNDIGVLTSCIPRIQSLTLTPKTNLNSDIVPSLLQLKHLRSLNISNCTWFDASSLCDIFHHLNRLSQLDVSLCPAVDDRVLACLGQQCIHDHTPALRDIPASAQTLVYMEHRLKEKRDVIEQLNVSGCAGITDEGLHTVIASHSNSLRSLSVSRCNQITDQSIVYLGNMANQLSELNLSFCSLITDNSLKSLSQLSNIQYLNINWCSKITDQGFESLKTLKRLRELRINALNVSDSISEILPEFTHLESISLSNYGDRLSQFPLIGLQFLSRLTSLVFASNTFSMYQAVQISGMTWLRHLDISWCRFQQGSLAFLRDLTGLEYLSLRQCVGHVQDFASIGSLHRLYHLDVTATGINNAALRTILFTCPRIAHLYVGWCPQLSEDVVPDIVQMPSLVEVDVSGNEMMWRRLRSGLQRRAMELGHEPGHRCGVRVVMQHVAEI
eukprot:gb/GECH01002919.1/.p1 GENE.gb/GECH01002919.1/~~gb/GECH01002919.1/.p1  ORF type:complete len:600 (+),score=108.66 gb/GECH01002919.1/:1-1800(+)